MEKMNVEKLLNIVDEIKALDYQAKEEIVKLQDYLKEIENRKANLENELDSSIKQYKQQKTNKYPQKGFNGQTR